MLGIQDGGQPALGTDCWLPRQNGCGIHVRVPDAHREANQHETSEFAATFITKTEQREQGACAQISLNSQMVLREGFL